MVSLGIFRKKLIGASLFLALLGVASNSSAGDFEFRSARLTITAVKPSDQPAYLALFRNKKFLDQENSNQPNLYDITDRFSESLNDFASLKEGADVGQVRQLEFCVRDKTGTILGFMSLYKPEGPSLYLKTSTMLDPAYWRKGYGREARQALIDFAFNRLRVAGLISMVSEDNEASRHLTETLGFKYLRAEKDSRALRKKVKFREYRLARITLAQPRTGGKKAILISAKLRTKLGLVARDSDIHQDTRVLKIYNLLISDERILKEAGPENLSAFAEGLVARPPNKLAQGFSEILSFFKSSTTERESCIDLLNW